jgi:hypothetical protein
VEEEIFWLPVGSERGLSGFLGSWLRWSKADMCLVNMIRTVKELNIFQKKIRFNGCMGAKVGLQVKFCVEKGKQ